MDFWESLAARMPRNLDYETLYEQFAWDLPHTYNMGVDICDRNAVDRGKLAIIHDRGNGDVEKWTFFELKRASDRFANALRGFGVERGDRVAILLTHSPELPIAHAATYKLGAIAVPLFTLFGEEALRFRLEDSGAKVLVTYVEHQEGASTLREEVEGLEHVVLTDGEAAGAENFYDLVKDSSSRFVPEKTAPEDPAIIIYTSGTTGAPKG
ncbi:MAG TPA: AMP-binding protein, partial [Rubrobacteraceae bacterium]|nr:AMP-binding protein [Rubrobacteraceae bacterium]